MKSERIIGNSKCEYLVMRYLYDSKPVYLISNACKKVEWIKKNIKIRPKEKGKKVNAPLFCLSLVDEYNYGMGNVDQADQLRIQYRICYWLQN